MGHLKRKLIFQSPIFRCYVSFGDGTRSRFFFLPRRSCFKEIFSKHTKHPVICLQKHMLSSPTHPQDLTTGSANQRTKSPFFSQRWRPCPFCGTQSLQLAQVDVLVYLSIHLCIYLSIYILFICLSVYLFIYL